ncbi:reduction in Cnn dots 6 [Rhynchophorus ferrugineus]|uniref:Uncharacterized protein n=1 Tax=Rhynchophorus ferrugineus TaxID=354439 RepID=A0A834I456_RHYFE|nr:hypothetical protein GWI33_013218 [Rhynchophorus ferrugineus]
MAFVEKCFCCSLPIACGFFAAYLLIAYLIAFAFELIWIILESSHTLPTAAVLLATGYFAMSLFAALLLHGLATKNIFCLVGWMFAVTVLTFPEAGLVIYMSVDYWGTGHIYGMTELSCWLIRIVINVVQIVLIQSLYTIWKEEDIVDKRMRDMSAGSAMGEPVPILNSQYYQNNGYDGSLDQLNMTNTMKRYGSMPHLWNTAIPNNTPLMQIPYAGYLSTASEFNASVFVPNMDHSELHEKKAQSLMDLRFLDQQAPMTYAQQWLSGSVNDTASIIEPKQRAMSEIHYSTLPAKMSRCQSVDALNTANKSSHIIRNRSGFYAQPIENYGVPIYYGPLDGPDFLIYKKRMEKLTSKNSLSNNSADDVQKYRDVAL